jgi:WD40 repeat protein
VWRIWNIARLTLKKGPVLLTSPTRTIGSIAVSPDSTLAAIQDADFLRIWDISNLNQPVELAELPSSAGVISFGPDGKTLVTSLDLNGGVQMWDMNLNDIAHRICQDIGTPMTSSQWNQYLPGQAFSPPCRTSRPVATFSR